MSGKFLSGKQVLVIDDEKFSRSIVVRQLQDYGAHAVHQATHGAEALALLSDPGKRVDLVICDFAMPGIDGLTVLKAIRTGFNNIRRDLTVVMLTGHTESSLVSSALLLDVDSFIAKPASKAGLAARIAKAMSEPRELRPVEEYRNVPTGQKFMPRAAEPPVPATPPPAPPPPAAEPSGVAEYAVALHELNEGGVLSRDICTAGGNVLLPAGTTLSLRYIKRLCELSSLGTAPTEVWLLDTQKDEVAEVG